MKTYKSVIFVILMILGVFSSFAKLAEVTPSAAVVMLAASLIGFLLAYNWANGSLRWPWWQTYAALVALEFFTTLVVAALYTAPLDRVFSDPVLWGHAILGELVRVGLFGWLFLEVRRAKQ